MRHPHSLRSESSLGSLLFTAVALLVALAGCDGLPTAERAEIPEPSLGFEQGPALSGQAPLLRFALPGSQGWALLVDTETNLAALASGTDDIRSGDDLLSTPEIENLCPGETRTSSNPLPFQVVTTRSDVQAALGTGDLFTWVYDFRGFPTLDCQFLTGATGDMLARGILPRTLQTNTASPQGAERLMATGNGRLEDLVHGGEVSAGIKLVVVSNATGHLVRADARVSLSPDPRF